MAKAIPGEDVVLFLKTAEKGEKNLSQTHGFQGDADIMGEGGCLPCLFYSHSFTLFPTLFLRGIQTYTLVVAQSYNSRLTNKCL